MRKFYFYVRVRGSLFNLWIIINGGDYNTLLEILYFPADLSADFN